MGRLRLAVVGETSYTDRLAQYIRKNGPEYLEVSICKDRKKTAAFLKDIMPDILLCEQEAAIQEEFSKDTVKILLSDTKGAKSDTDAVIFRYQHGAELLRQIFWIYGQASKKEVSCWYKTDDIQMSAVYAPGGHELQLAFSIAYASICGEKNRVLYLNLSEFSGMLPLFGETEGENISDLVYGIRQRRDKFPFFLQSVLHHTEYFDYVLPPINPKDLYEIQEEDLLNLLSLLTEQTDYQCIIWQIGTLNHLTGQILKHCSRVFCTVKENSFGKYRKKEFEKFLEKDEGKELRQKVIYVSPQNGNGNAFLQGADKLAQLQSGEFVEQVKKLINEQEERENYSE